MYKRTCIKCGKEDTLVKKPKSELCKRCAVTQASNKRKDPSKTTCPKCGGPKAYRSKMCAKCAPRDGENNPMFGKTNKPSKEAIAKRSGENHWNWQGGKSTKRSGKQIAWSKEIIKKYGNVCDCCGYSRGWAMEAHHYETSENKQHTFGENDGVALCSNCHKEFHKRFGRQDTTKEMYIQMKEEINKCQE